MSQAGLSLSGFCPHSDPFDIGGRAFTAQAITEALSRYISDSRRARIEKVVGGRSFSIVPVLDGLYDRGNVSAVLRTAEALGFQAVHIVESSGRFKEANRVTQGAEKWLDIRIWPDSPSCVADLREKGYRIVATSLEEATPIEQVDFSTPAAIFFGNEREGVSPEVLEQADARIVVPMPGFSRSFNISVAAALSLYHIYSERQRLLGGHADLTESERAALTASFYLRSVESSAKILGRLSEDRPA